MTEISGNVNLIRYPYLMREDKSFLARVTNVCGGLGVVYYLGIVYLLYMLYFKMSCVYCCSCLVCIVVSCLVCIVVSCIVCIVVVVLCVLL